MGWKVSKMTDDVVTFGEADVKRCCAKYASRYGELKLFWSELWDLDTQFDQTWPNNKMAGCYAIFNGKKELLYIGKTNCMGSRLGTYFRSDVPKNRGVPKDRNAWSATPRYVLTVGLENGYEASSLEEYLIQELRPCDNRLGKRTTLR